MNNAEFEKIKKEIGTKIATDLGFQIGKYKPRVSKSYLIYKLKMEKIMDFLLKSKG